jgi:hypothetical protein
MSISAARCRFGFLVAIAIAAMPFLAQPLPVAASSAGTLFAFVGSNQTVARLDPATGSLTTIADLSLPSGQPAPSFGNMVIDPSMHRLYVPRTVIADFSFTSISHQLITIDTQAGGITHISPSMGEGVFDLVFDTSSGALYGHTQNCCPFNLVRIDPVSGALTYVAALPGVQQGFMAVAPSNHSIYMTSQSFAPGQFQPINTMLTVDPVGNTVFESPPMSTGVFALLYDTSSGALLGKSFCCPAHLVSVIPSTGVAAPIGTFDMGYTSGLTIDSSSHTIFAAVVNFGAYGMTTDIVSINDQTGAAVVDSTISSGTMLSALAFEPVGITTDSIRADVRSALSSGAIDSAGVANALLSQLNAAAAARTAGQCTTAASIYQAFINAVNAQSGKHVAAATAANLVSEAQFLKANCP